jgi:adenylate cyclase
MPPRRRLAAIMFTDMVGYSALVQADESAALKVLERQNRVLRPIFDRHRGREVKTVGDAFLVEFESALDAVRAGLEIQKALEEYNSASARKWMIQIRVGIHVGDVVQTKGDILGDAVNIASRIQALAEPGGITVTQQVIDQVQSKVTVRFERLPPTPLKNIRTAVSVYRVVPPGTTGPLSVRAPAPGAGRQLAVLPLSNISPDPADGYFADGLTEELISVLSQVRGLSVTARTSVMPYKTEPKSVAQVGAELGVDTVLEGSVRKAGNRIRITLQLVDVATQRHVWANSYNRELDDVFAVQTDVAERTAEALRLELVQGAGGAAPRRPTANLAAYDLYLRGLSELSRVTPDSRLERITQLFEDATKLDPGFAEAYAAWANTYVMAAGDHVAMNDVIPKARELTSKALRIDPDSSEAHSSLANILFQYDNDWARAEAEFRRAIELNPSNVIAYRFYSLMLFALGRYDEAREAVRRAISLDPGGEFRGMLAWIDVESGNLDVGIRESEEDRDREPEELSSHIYAGMYYLTAGRRADAEREAAFTAPHATETEQFDHALLMALLGRPEEARERLKRIEGGKVADYNSGTHLAMLYSVLGDKSRAIELLEKDYERGERVLWLWHRGIFFDAIRDEPRFQALLKRYGLPPDIHRPLVSDGPAGHSRRRAHSRAP